MIHTSQQEYTCPADLLPNPELREASKDAMAVVVGYPKKYPHYSCLKPGIIQKTILFFKSFIVSFADK